MPRLNGREETFELTTDSSPPPSPLTTTTVDGYVQKRAARQTGRHAVTEIGESRDRILLFVVWDSSAPVNARPPCCRYANTQDKDPDMQTDLHDFLARIARTIAMTLVPMAFIAFVTLPASLHHHIGTPAKVEAIAPQHMT
jgi:hypothetical protein